MENEYRLELKSSPTHTAATIRKGIGDWSNTLWMSAQLCHETSSEMFWQICGQRGHTSELYVQFIEKLKEVYPNKNIIFSLGHSYFYHPKDAEEAVLKTLDEVVSEGRRLGRFVEGRRDKTYHGHRSIEEGLENIITLAKASLNIIHNHSEWYKKSHLT